MGLSEKVTGCFLAEKQETSNKKNLKLYQIHPEVKKVDIHNGLLPKYDMIMLDFMDTIEYPP